MKVLDLQCPQCHSFEGWFGSEDDFQSQLARGLVQCPMCDDRTITKKLSAPRLNLIGNQANSSTHDRNAREHGANDHPQADSAAAPGSMATGTANGQEAASDKLALAAMQDPQFQAAYLRMARAMLAKTEDVGNQFAEEARKMYYGEADERAIRGQATHTQALELLDEGIDVMPLLLPKALKASLQ